TEAEPIAALLAVQILMATVQRRGHRPGGDDKGLRLEGPEQKCQHERKHDRLERFPRAFASFRGRLVPARLGFVFFLSHAEHRDAELSFSWISSGCLDVRS